MATNTCTNTLLKDLRVCMLINNDIVRDGRVLKKARTLSAAGAQVLVIGQGASRDIALDGEQFESVIVSEPCPYQHPRLGQEDVWWPLRVFTNLTYSKMKYAIKKRLIARNQFENNNMIKFAVDFKPQVVEANDVFTCTDALEIARRCSAAFIYDTHEFFQGYFLGHQNDIHRQFLSDKIERQGFSAARISLTPAPFISKMVHDDYPEKTVVTLLNSLPFEERATETVHRPVRLLDQTSVRAINGHEMVIYAMQSMRGRATYTIQGQCLDEGYRKSLEDQIRNLGLSEVVFLEGAFAPDEAIERATNFDIGLASYPFDVASKQNTLANRVFTYLNAGLAIAVCGSAANLSLDGFNEYGIVLDITSPQTIVDSLTPLIDNPGLLLQKKQAAFRWAPYFSWEHQAEKYLHEYQMLAKSL